MTNLDSMLKSRDITWPTMVRLVQAMVFPIVIYGCENWPIKIEGAQRKWCRKTSGFLSRETGMPGNFVGRIKGVKDRFDLQFLTWDFS